MSSFSIVIVCCKADICYAKGCFGQHSLFSTGRAGLLSCGWSRFSP